MFIEGKDILKSVIPRFTSGWTIFGSLSVTGKDYTEILAYIQDRLKLFTYEKCITNITIPVHKNVVLFSWLDENDTLYWELRL